MYIVFHTQPAGSSPQHMVGFEHSPYAAFYPLFTISKNFPDPVTALQEEAALSYPGIRKENQV